MLLTDFGQRDPYVGVMKGVILARAPKAAVVDLCHEIRPQDVRGAAFALRISVPYFPKGSLFVAVVDPGVGSGRRILWARTKNHQFLAPDNGLLSWLEGPILELRSVENSALFLPRVSATFHGRDIFAPVAARLSRGLAPKRLGPAVSDYVRIPLSVPGRTAAGVRGEVLWIDRFGNAVTNLRREHAKDSGRVLFRGRPVAVCGHYAQAPAGRPLALIGSSGFLELSIRGGDFAERHKARPGDKIEYRN